MAKLTKDQRKALNNLFMKYIYGGGWKITTYAVDHKDLAEALHRLGFVTLAGEVMQLPRPQDGQK